MKLVSPPLIHQQAHTQDFQKGGYMDVESVCLNVRLGGSGGMLPQEIRCTEIASKAILGQKQNRSIVASLPCVLCSLPCVLCSQTLIRKGAFAKPRPPALKCVIGIFKCEFEL